jgi:hypothetical protein
MAATLLSAAIACDCGGREVDVFHYHCTDASTCGAGWSCVNGACVEGTAGGSGDGGAVGGGGATGGGGAVGGGAALGGGSQSGGGGATGGGGGMIFDAGAKCDDRTGTPCGPGYTCLWNGSLGDLFTGFCSPGCNPWAPDCGAGLRCAINPPDFTFECVDAGADGEGDSCSPMSPDSCQAGLVCSFDVGGDARCRHFCNWTDAGCPAGQYCTYTTPANPGEVWVCGPNPCSVLAQDCGGFETCQAVYGGGNECRSPGNGDAGATCVGLNDCSTGLSCFRANGKSTCEPFCNRDGSAPTCPGTQACTAAIDATGFPIEGNTAGICL